MRLTDRAIDNVHALLTCRTTGAIAVEVRSAIIDALDELRERRAADLSEHEREALAWVRAQVRLDLAHGETWTETALAALDRILGGKDGAK